MGLEILMACMYQEDHKLIEKSGITGDAVVINQCDREDYIEYQTANGLAKMFFTTQRGLTKSRNMAIEKSKADIIIKPDFGS